MGIIPIRSRVIVKGISAIAFLEVSTRHDMTLLLAMKNLSFAGRLLPVDVANESQRTDPDRLFDPFCNGPSCSPAAPNPQQGSTVSSVERTTSKSSFGRGGGGRGSGSGSFKRSPAGSMSNWTRHSGETEGNGADASANVSFSGNSPSLGSALKTTQQGANNRNDSTTRVHSNNSGSFGSATGPGTSPSKAFPLAAPSSKAWRPSGKAVRFANESSGGPAIGEINYDSSGSQSINNSFSSATPSQSGTVAAGSAQLHVPGSAELLWRHRYRALIGGLNDTVTAHDLRKLFEDVGLTVIAVEAVPATENEAPTVSKSMYMEVGDEEQLKHVLCQHGRRIKGIEMTITLPPPAQQQERKGSDRGIQRSSSDDPASAFLTRALAAEVTLMSMDYDEAAKGEENERVPEGCMGGRADKEEKADRLRQTTFAPCDSLITTSVEVERTPYDDDDACDHDDCEDNRYYYYATRRNQQFSDKLHASGGGDSDYGESRWGIGEEEDTNTVLTGYSLRGNASNTNKSTAANTFIGEDDVDYLREGVGDEDSLPLRDDGGDEEGQQLRQLSTARTSSRASPDGRGRSASRTVRERERHQPRGLSGLEFTHMTITDTQRSVETLSGSQNAISVPERTLTSPSAPRPPNSPFIRSQTFGSAFAPSNVATAAASSVGEDVSTYMHSDEEEEMVEFGSKRVAFEFEAHETDIVHHSTKAPVQVDGYNPEVSVIVATSSTRRVEFSIPADHEPSTIATNVQELSAHVIVEKTHEEEEEENPSAFDHRHVDGKDISATSSRLSREASSEVAVDSRKLINTSSLQSSCGCTPPTRLATVSGTIDAETGDDARERELSVTPRLANETTSPTIARREGEARVEGGVPRPTPFNLNGEHIVIAPIEANGETEVDREADNASAGTYPFEDRQVSCDIFDDAAEDNTVREQAEQRMNNNKLKMPSAPPRPIAFGSPNEPQRDTSSQMQSPHPAAPNAKGTRWCVYVGNLRTGTSDQEVSDFFIGKPASTSGSPPSSCKQSACIGVEALVVRMRTNAKCTFAFVDVPSEEALRKCVASSGIIFNGRPARIVPAKHAYHHGHDSVGFSNTNTVTPNSPPLVKTTTVRSSHPPLAPKPVLASSQPDESEDAMVLRDDDTKNMGMGMQRTSTSLDVEMHISPSCEESSAATNDRVIRVDSNNLVSSREDSNSQIRVPIVPPAPQMSPCPKVAASPPPPPPEALLSVNRQSPSLAPSSGRSSILTRPSPPTQQQQPYNTGSHMLGNFSLPPSAVAGPTTFSHSPWQVGASQYQRVGENGGLNRSCHVNSYSAAAARARAAASAQCPSNAAVEALMKDPIMESRGSSMLETVEWQQQETKSKPSQCRHCVYVGNLPTGTTVDDVRSFFDQVMGFFPLVVRIRSNEKSTFAFVDVSSEEELHQAVCKNGSVTLGSRPLRIRRSQTAY